MSYAVPDMYSFFESYKNYKRYESHIENNYLQGKHNTKCYSFLKDVIISRTDSANSICEKFKHFYQFLISTKRTPKSGILEDKDFAFLNYWLNDKLRNNAISHNLTVEHFHEKMNDHEDEFASYDMFKGKLYSIKDEDFNNIILLSLLEECYSDFYAKIIAHTKDTSISCLEYTQKLIDTYKKGIIKCSVDDTNFCQALKHFKQKYENFVFKDYSITEICIDRELIKLPQYNDVSLDDKKITVVGSILGPSFGTLFTLAFLYKLTPLGQWIHAKMGTKRGAHSNIYVENDQSLLNTSDNENINFDENSYNISYDSIGNL
ncbi:PIR protein [Plasmodium ovale]|uniref:PIR Superfamily Protein n=2 Tax=Plasmodium ovale TaxID=36330 RepID=A0A1A8WF27_PLAOA|nr:PIR Superfamily Protein [Plasmodium ovale curtisi]SCP05933.1 PIR protein [Plasmodium ovale]